jgi:hypothetical protein
MSHTSTTDVSAYCVIHGPEVKFFLEAKSARTHLCSWMLYADR